MEFIADLQRELTPDELIDCFFDSTLREFDFSSDEMMAVLQGVAVKNDDETF